RKAANRGRHDSVCQQCEFRFASAHPPMSTTAYSLAQEVYAGHGVDTEAALQTLARTPLSLHCWQGDDVRGFEHGAGDPGGGLAVTGAYPPPGSPAPCSK